MIVIREIILVGILAKSGYEDTERICLIFIYHGPSRSNPLVASINISYLMLEK